MDIITTNTTTAISTETASIGEQFDRAAGAAVFSAYQSRRAANTVIRHMKELAAFGDFLKSVGIPNSGMNTPEEWKPITFGILRGYQEALLKKGYAVSSVNGSISILRAYARLAAQAGCITPEAFALISTVKGFAGAEAKHIDSARAQTRRGRKKEGWTVITREQAQALKGQQTETLKDRRDRVLITILLDHGARISEVISLKRASIDLEQNTITFYRSKTNRTDMHSLTEDSRQALVDYLESVHLEADDALLVTVSKADRAGRPLSIRGASQIVQEAGAAIGLSSLSPHDCRHYFATAAARGGTPLEVIQQAGGWASLAMPARYISRTRIGNQGVHFL